MNPYDKARELKLAIEQSDVYKKFKEAKTQMETDESAKEMVDDFREKQFDMQRREMLGEEVNEKELEKIQELYNILNMNKIAAEYFNAEFGYARLMQDVSEILAEIME